MMNFNLGNATGFKKSEILKLIQEFDGSFSFDTDTTINHQQTTITNQAKKIAELTTSLEQANIDKDNLLNQIEQLKAGEPNQSDTPAEKINEGQGDTLLILGALMTTIEQVAKTNYTQTNHIQIILDHFEAKGLSESTISKKIANAKKHLTQKSTPKENK